jgi:hypothetical protein
VARTLSHLKNHFLDRSKLVNEREGATSEFAEELEDSGLDEPLVTLFHQFRREHAGGA